jgi:hypothetical protein
MEGLLIGRRNRPRVRRRRTAGSQVVVEMLENPADRRHRGDHRQRGHALATELLPARQRRFRRPVHHARLDRCGSRRCSPVRGHAAFGKSTFRAGAVPFWPSPEGFVGRCENNRGKGEKFLREAGTAFRSDVFELRRRRRPPDLRLAKASLLPPHPPYTALQADPFGSAFFAIGAVGQAGASAAFRRDRTGCRRVDAGDGSRPRWSSRPRRQPRRPRTPHCHSPSWSERPLTTSARCLDTARLASGRRRWRPPGRSPAPTATLQPVARASAPLSTERASLVSLADRLSK